jgi:hypothetical protein
MTSGSPTGLRPDLRVASLLDFGQYNISPKPFSAENVVLQAPAPKKAQAGVLISDVATISQKTSLISPPQYNY